MSLIVARLVRAIAIALVLVLMLLEPLVRRLRRSSIASTAAVPATAVPTTTTATATTAFIAATEAATGCNVSWIITRGEEALEFAR
jgi:hypothetical protein